MKTTSLLWLLAFVAGALIPVQAAANAALSKSIHGNVPFSALILFAVAGACVAGRHLWIQSLPADQVPLCNSMGIDYMLDAMPMLDAITFPPAHGSGAQGIDMQPRTEPSRLAASRPSTKPNTCPLRDATSTSQSRSPPSSKRPVDE